MNYQYGQNGGEENNRYQGNNNYTYYNSEPYGTGMASGGPKKKEKKSGRGIIPVCVVLSLLAGTAGGALGSGLVLNHNYKTAAEVQSQETELETTGAAAEVQTPVQASSAQIATGMSVEQIAKECLPSVVAITNKGETEIRSLWGTFTQESESSGSGVIIGKTDQELLIITNYHVVSGAEELSVLFSYQENMSDTEIASAKMKDYDAGKDLAVIAIDLSSLSQETLDNIKVAAIGDSNDLTMGEQIVAIGNALGYGQSVTTGIVSALGRSVTVQDASSGSSSDTNQYIQTDAAINPGNSGGAMFNMRGELVGINSAKIANTQVEGVGYAIPISDVNEDIQKMMLRETRDLVEESERGYLGINVSNVTAEISQTYDIPIGAHISSVTEGSPADQAGLQRGMVITEIEGKSVGSGDELREYLDYYKAGETVELTVEVRTDAGYEEKEISVTLCSAEEAGVSDSSEGGKGQAPDQNGQNGQNGGWNSYNGFFPFFGN